MYERIIIMLSIITNHWIMNNEINFDQCCLAVEEQCSLLISDTRHEILSLLCVWREIKVTVLVINHGNIYYHFNYTIGLA